MRYVKASNKAIRQRKSWPSFEESASLKKELVEIATEGANGGAGSAAENPD